MWSEGCLQKAACRASCFLYTAFEPGDAAQVYNVTSSKNQPKWLSDKKKKKSLRKDEEYR